MSLPKWRWGSLCREAGHARGLGKHIDGGRRDVSVHVPGGTDAEAAAYVQLNIDGKRISGAARDRDTVSASLMAVMAALNRAVESHSSAA